MRLKYLQHNLANLQVNTAALVQLFAAKGSVFGAKKLDQTA
jgi:hypothetical protein